MSSQPHNDDPAAAGQAHLNVAADQTLHEFEKQVADLAQPNYLFRLYVSGTSPRSALAITNLRNICESYLQGRYELEVIDVYQQMKATKEAQIVAVPTLIKELPLPPQRFVGDMSNTEKIVVGLKLKHANGAQ
jgi:circadian clock protein KaiB